MAVSFSGISQFIKYRKSSSKYCEMAEKFRAQEIGLMKSVCVCVCVYVCVCVCVCVCARQDHQVSSL